MSYIDIFFNSAPRATTKPMKLTELSRNLRLRRATQPLESSSRYVGIPVRCAYLVLSFNDMFILNVIATATHLRTLPLLLGCRGNHDTIPSRSPSKKFRGEASISQPTHLDDEEDEVNLLTICFYLAAYTTYSYREFLFSRSLII